METRELMKLGRFYEDNLALSSWFIILAAKLAVSGRMDLVSDMATYAKMAMRTNTSGMNFPSCIYL